MARWVSRAYVLGSHREQPLVEQLVQAGLGHLHAVFERLGRLGPPTRDDLLVAVVPAGELHDLVVLVLDFELVRAGHVEKRPQLPHVDELRGDGFQVLVVLDEELGELVEETPW